MTDLGPEEMDAWANRHPRLARTIMVGSVWAVLQGAAFLFASLGIEPVGGFFTGVANLMLLIWCGVLLYMNREHAGPAIGRFWDGVVEQVLIIVSRQTLRTYRFEGERAAHEEQARETTISLGLMAQAAADDPTQVRMASDIEHGAEARLTVLLGKPQLSLAEKRERDAIQRHLQARRAGFEPAMATSAPRAPQGFLSLAAPRVQFWPIVAAVAVVIGLVQTVRVERVKSDARDLRDAVAAESDRANAAETQARMNEVALESTRHEVNVSRELNETLQARQERLEARQRRSSREQVDAARSGRPVDLDGRLRDFGIQPLASPDHGAGPAPDPAGGMYERPAGALDLSTPGALPTGDHGPGARDSNVPG